MIKKNCNRYRAICVVTISSVLFAAPGLSAEESQPASEAVSEETKAFLSDPGRAGSLLGSILAGAALANPLAPLVGSVAGFFIGKNTDYTDKSSNAQRYANRSFIPEDGRRVASLDGLTGKLPQESEQLGIQIIALETGMENLVDETEQTVVQALALNTGTEVDTGMEILPEQIEQPQSQELVRKKPVPANLQQQIAYACANVDFTQPMPVHCYYFSQ